MATNRIQLTIDDEYTIETSDHHHCR